MTTHPINTEALRKLADAATPGPWPLLSGGEYVGGVGLLVAPDDGGVSPADAAFIAAARTAIPALLDQLAATEHRATRAEAKADVRANQTAHWQEQAGIWQEHAQWLSKRAVQAEARITAAVAILDEDPRWQNEEHLLARVREALDGGA